MASEYGWLIKDILALTSRQFFGFVSTIYRRQYKELRTEAAIFANVKLPELPETVDTSKVPDLKPDEVAAFDRALAEARERKMKERKRHEQ